MVHSLPALKKRLENSRGLTDRAGRFRSPMPSVTFDDNSMVPFHTPSNLMAGTLLAECWGKGFQGANGDLTGGDGGGGGAYAAGLLPNGPGVDVAYDVDDSGTGFTTAGNATEVIAASGAGIDGGKAASSTGTVKWDGGDGGDASAGIDGGGGGGSATPLAPGGGGHVIAGGIGEGNGGDGGTVGAPDGLPGEPPGGGGGGGFKTIGLKAVGANGRVRFSWAEAPPPPPPVVITGRPGFAFATGSGTRESTMNATQAILTQLSALLGADTTTLAGALKVGLAMNNFTPGPQLTAADLTPATFTGSTLITVAAATRPDNFDPATGDRIITITPPAGGYLWSTTDAVNLPQTIYGAYVGTSTPPAGNLYGAFLFDTPIVLTVADQQVSVDEVAFRLLASGVQ